MRDTPPPLTSCAAPTFQRENFCPRYPPKKDTWPLLSDPLAGKSPECHTLDPQASTRTPRRFPWSRPLPVATRLPHGGDAHARRPARVHMTTSSSGPPVRSIGLSPASDLAQWALSSRPLGAAKWSICLQGQPQAICLPKGGRTSPRGGPELGRAGVSKKRKQG